MGPLTLVPVLCDGNMPSSSVSLSTAPAVETWLTALTAEIIMSSQPAVAHICNRPYDAELRHSSQLLGMRKIESGRCALRWWQHGVELSSEDGAKRRGDDEPRLERGCCSFWLERHHLMKHGCVWALVQCRGASPSSGGGRSFQTEVLAESHQAAETWPTSLAACIFLSCFHVALPPISLCLTLLLLLLFPERIYIFWKSKTESWHKKSS